MTHVVQQVSDDSPAGLRFYGGAREFWRYKGFEALLTGPYECLAGESLLFDPISQTSQPIEWYYRNRIAPTVLTLYGATKANIPFLKGYAPLYRVVLESGHSFIATKGHRVLTQRGWICVSELLVSECLLGFAESPPVSTLELCREVSLQDARHYANITQDYPACYSACYHPYDAQPQRGQGSAQAFVPLQADAPVHTHVGHNRGECDSLSEYNHPHLQYVPLSSDHSAPLSDLLYANWDAEYFDVPHTPAHGFGLSLPPLQYPLALLHQQPSDVPVHHAFHKPFFASSLFPPLDNYTVFISTISRVEYVRDDYYYDLNVPYYGHYLADGIWHHNTGKTLAALTKLHALLCKYPHARAVMLRKTYKSLTKSAVVTYEKKVLPFMPDDPRSGVKKYGGERPEFYDYVNGSRLECAGMDNPSKVLSSEYDYIYINQLEELKVGEYETLTGRATGRAGNVPYTQVFGDCNPGAPTHWILARKQLIRFPQMHEHNPTLFNQETGEITEQGKRTMGILDALTGVRYKRGRLGLWVAAEGAVFEEFDPDVHIVKELPKDPFYFRRILATVDFGWTNPGVIQVWAVDGDGRLWLLHEVYMTGRQVHDWWIPKAKHLKERYRIETFYCDPSEPGYIDQFNAAELSAIGAENDISTGIDFIKQRLSTRRMFLYAEALEATDPELELRHLPTCLADEFPLLEWVKSPQHQSQERNPKDVPNDLHNHGIDCARYICNALDAVQGVLIARL